MARQSRLDLAGIPLHVIQRGNNRAPCFFADADRRLYLRCLADASVRNECAIHAYVLMPNHVHLLVTPRLSGGVSGMMQDVGRRYVRLFNDVHNRSGTLWEGRYKSCLIDTDSYYFTCHRYIELNPVRAGLVNDPMKYLWSSHRYYALAHPDPLITEHPLYRRLAETISERRSAFWALFQQSIDPEVLDRIRSTVNQGWALGSDEFLDQMEVALGRSARPPKRGRPFKDKQQDPNADDEPDGQTKMLI